MQLSQISSFLGSLTAAHSGRKPHPKPSDPTPTDSVSIGKSPRTTYGNTVTPFFGGDKATDEVLTQLASAKSSIQVEMYRLGYDKIVDLLAKQAQAGVKVQVLLDPTPGYDAADAQEQTRIREFLKSKGVEILTYPIDKSGKIDHVKLLIVDGQRAVIGGLNWDKHSHFNLDFDVRVEGDAVSDLSGIWTHDWKVSGGGATATANPTRPSGATAGDATVRVATTEVDSEGIRKMLLDNINGARKSIRMMAFALADKQVIDALIKAKKERNVDVKILLDPNKPVSYVNEKSKKLLEAAGIEVRYLKVNLDTEEKLHAKTAAFDDEKVMLGSANFTDKGLTVNHEAEIEVTSKSVGTAFTGFFDDIFQNRSLAKLPNIPDLEERASSEPYGESVAHRLFGWYNDTYRPGETVHFSGKAKKAVMEAMDNYGQKGGRAGDDAPIPEQVGAMAAFLNKAHVWDIDPAPGSGEKVYKRRMEIAQLGEQTVGQHIPEYKQKMVDMVTDPQLKGVLRDILDHAPEGFYKSPSSSTGHYHPANETRLADVKPRLEPPTEEELAKYPGGGLVLHSLRNMVLAGSLCDYYGIQGRARDEVLMGESLHDIAKFVTAKDMTSWQPGQPVPWGKYTTPDHAHAGAIFVQKLDPTGGSATVNVRRYIDMHMGAWNAPEPTPPKNDAERIISLADYLASTSDYYVKV